MEIIDIYDRDGRPTGRVRERRSPLNPGEYSRICQVVLFNSAGQILIQQRAAGKFWGDMWDLSACGCLLAGESGREAAERELKEELGLIYDFTEAIPPVTVFYGEGFTDVFLGELEVDADTLRLQASEVQAARWEKPEVILEMIEAGTFVHYHPAWIRYLCEIRTGYGNFLRDK